MVDSEFACRLKRLLSVSIQEYRVHAIISTFRDSDRHGREDSQLRHA